MDLDELIRTRRTYKAYEPAPVPRDTLEELFELARWAPNHHLTNPWRFRVLGPRALEALKAAAGPEAAPKLDRAPTLVAASVTQGGEDPVSDEERFDVLVVGGGITGAGVALDAATRGYSVALIERGDYAIGTSSRSSKLVHGGLRYLQNFDLGLVREALIERQVNVALAPHLVRPLPIVVPAFDGARPDRLVGLGLNMYDVMSRRRGRDDAEWSPARHRVVSGEEVVELLPALAARRPSAGYLFYDCQTDDVRLVRTVLGEAESFGAVMANRVEVTYVVAEGVRAMDLET